MGTRQTPAHTGVVLPPQPAARILSESGASSVEAPPPSERTELRTRERESSSGAALAGTPAAAGVPVEPAAGSPPVSADVTSTEAVAADAASADAAADVEARVSEPESPRRPSVPSLPVAALERPTALRAELTPSPVPRVSLVPPTGRIDSRQLAELSALESRKLPTVAPRLLPTHLPAGGALPTPSFTIPLMLKPRPLGLAGRLANDVRNSKREIALGLVIGIVLSFVLGKLGQSYLESRGRGSTLVVQSFANEPAPAAPRSAAPASSPPPATGAKPVVASPPADTAAPRLPDAPPRGTGTGATPPPRRAPGQRASPSPPPSPSENAGLGLELPL